MDIILQKWRKQLPSDIQKAVKYYWLLSVCNDLGFTTKQVELLAFTAVRGTITSPSARSEFVEIFGSSLASLENVKNKLKRRGWLIRMDNKYRVNPRVNLDFSRDIILQINLSTTNEKK